MRKLRPSSMFARICVLMLALAFFVTLFLSLFSLFAENHRMEQQMLRTGTETAERASATVSAGLGSLSRILESTFMGTDVIRTALSPELARVENMQTVTDALTAAVDASDSIDSIYVYSVKNKIGLSSDYSVSGWQMDSWLGVLSRFLTRRAKLTPATAGGTPVYYYNEGTDIYIVGGFPDVRYEGCSLYTMLHVAPRAFAASVNASGSGSIRFFDANGTELLRTRGEGADAAALWQTVRNAGTAGGNASFSPEAGKTERLIWCTDPVTGWVCVYATEPEGTLMARLNGSALPAVVLWTVFVLCGLLLITKGARSLSRPLENLVEKVRILSPEGTEEGDDWAFLGASYARLSDRKAELERYLPIASEAIEEDLFRSLLAGEPLEKEEVAHRLELSGSAFRPDAPAAVFLADVSANEEAENAPDTMASAIAYFELGDKLHKLLGESGTVFRLMRGRDDAAVLICALPKEGTEEAYRGLCAKIASTASPDGTPVWGFGKPCESVSALSASAEEARRNLDYYRYHRDGEEASSASSAYRRIIEFLHDLSARIRSGGIEDPEAETARAVRDIAESVEEPGLKRELYHMLLDILLAEEPGHDAAVTAETLLPAETDGEELRQRAEELCLETARHIGSGLASGQDRRVLRVCRYIETHYSDPGLSLEQAADYAGVSPSHLSRSFTAVMQKNFTAYLNECRVENAKKLLETTELPAQEVGYLTGFCSMATFFRVFKKTTGVTPKQYRTGSAGTEAEQ